MGIDNMQLKQEEVLNDNVVLTDINPVSNTKSIDDSATGEKLQDTISRIWSSINNKLTRVVNSVNGRAGVVVLNKEDVGLGNVDDISYNEIKDWVIEELEKYFDNKKIRLYENIDGVRTDVGTNDKKLAWAPFYCERYDENDLRACIGYFTWNDAVGELNYSYRSINTIGGTDHSLWYRTNTNDPNPIDGTIPVGELRVNIFKEPNPDDQLLFLHEGTDITNSGLRIDFGKIGTNVIFVDKLYDGTVGMFDANNMLIYGDPTEAQITERCHYADIYINDVKLTSGPYGPTDQEGNQKFLINKNWKYYNQLKKNAMLITNFSRSVSGSMTKNEQALMSREPAIGTVVQGISVLSPDEPIVIKFTTIRPYTNGYGIQTITTHLNRPEGQRDSQLGIDLGVMGYMNNMSGMQTLTGPISITNDQSTWHVPRIDVYAPWYIVSSDEVSVSAQNQVQGLFITSDNTLSIYPLSKLKPNNLKGTYRGKYYVGDLDDNDTPDKCIGSRYISNYSWSKKNSLTNDTDSDYGYSNGHGNTQSMLSLNMNKLVFFEFGHEQSYITAEIPDTMYFMNMSGLRDNDTYMNSWIDRQADPDQPYHNVRQYLTEEQLRRYGMPDHKDVDGNIVDKSNDYQFNGMSGGISVNVGRFLEITPRRYPIAEDYYEGGKVQVRTSKGLTEEVVIQDIDLEGWNTDEPSDSFKEAERDWHIYTDEFYYKTDLMTDWVLVPTSITLDESETEPDQPNWQTHYYKQWMKKINAQGTLGMTSEYVFLPKGDGAPQWEPGRYYQYNRPDIRLFILSTIGQNVQLQRRIKSNRMTLDIDNDTLQFDEETGKLKVARGGSGGSGNGSKLRFIDDRGYFFDTDDDETVQPDRVIKVGNGLSVVGSGNIPLDYITTVPMYQDTLRELCSASVFSVFEYWLYVKNHPGETDINNYTWYTVALNSYPSSIPITSSSTKSALNTVYEDLGKCISGFEEFLKEKPGASIIVDNIEYTYPNLHMYFTDTKHALWSRLSIITDAMLRYDTTTASAADIVFNYKRWELLMFRYEKPNASASQSGAFIIENYNPSTVGKQEASYPIYYCFPLIKMVHGEETYPLDWLFGFFVSVVLFPELQIIGDVLNNDGYALLNEEPSDWSNVYNQYYVRTWNPSSAGWDYTGATETENAPTWEENTYFKLINGTYSLTTSKPSNWETAFATYYTRSGTEGSYVYTSVHGVVGPPPFALWKFWYVGDPNTPITGRFSLLLSKPANWDTLYNEYYTQSLVIPNSYVKVQGVVRVVAPDFQTGMYYEQIIEGYKVDNAFYSDEEHQHQITPETTKVYHDQAEDKYYHWDGTNYVETTINTGGDS